MKISLDRGPLGLLARLAIRGCIRSLHWSARVEIQGLERMQFVLDSDRPLIFAVWHGSILSTVICRRSMTIPRLLTMVSRSRDGDLATRVSGPLGGDFVRASSSKGATAGVLEFRRAMARRDASGQPRASVHFLDGPRGPRRKAKAGIVHLARAAGAWVVPAEYGASRYFAARSWDRHIVPLPFARIVMSFGEPIDFGSDSGADAAVAMEDDDEAAGEAAAGEASSGARSRVSSGLAEIEASLARLARENPLYVELPDIERRPRAERR